ncbi:hypothetical protein EMA8858_02366 [Emticicia aquatica]|jgi:hypothetical protein|uniref:Right handed beta helix domain-containing protein n=1 Tax=Emticicia aquatica TaxID=1681835 RepID=A0ABM9ARA3_9BACT|nr:hypothetical protein [Emticicia aquatica]CAH0996235.1 hypothetical protein EMA8858_02366 [Emticicia aquatica]
MKKIISTSILSIIALLFTCISIYAQTIRRCNNNVGVSGLNVYTTIQAAHDAAADGDIIYVEPSASSYGTLDCTKRLSIIGNGYFLAQNSNVSFDLRMSMINGITFNAGSANTSVTGIYTNNLGFNNVSNITIERCYIQNTNYIAFSSASQSFITFSKCFITGNIWGYSEAHSPENCTFKNNIIGGGIKYFSNSVFTNNTFSTQNNSTLTNLVNSTIANNIFRSNACNSCVQQLLFDPIIHTGTTISNNIIACLPTGNTCSFILPTGNGNINNGDYSTLFLLSDPYDVGLIDKNFQLVLTSPAKGVGTGGTDAGAFGGANPYVLSGLPTVPITTNFTTSGAGNTSVPLQVSVTVRANN